MLQQNHDDIGNLWIIIKQVRKSYLIGYDDPKCQKDNQIAKNDIQKNIDNVAKNLAISSMDYDFHENIIEPAEILSNDDKNDVVTSKARKTEVVTIFPDFSFFKVL